jgi:hypothetical protein
VTELMKPAAFYHLWVGDEHHGANWLPPAREFFTALYDSWFDGDVRVGIVGGPAQREEAERWLDVNRGAGCWSLAAAADDGFEMVTLDVLHQFAKGADPETPVLYAHGKGSFQGGPFADAWRRNMTLHLVGRWKHCVNSLNDYDCVGCHVLTREQFPDKIFQPLIIGGNFWWATAGYLATLAPIDPQGTNRYAAEGWIGLNNPKVECLVEGWPDY